MAPFNHQAIDLRSSEFRLLRLEEVLRVAHGQKWHDTDFMDLFLSQRRAEVRISEQVLELALRRDKTVASKLKNRHESLHSLQRQ